MTDETASDMEQAISELKTLTTDEQIEFIREKIPSGIIQCAVCSSKNVNFLGTDEQLFMFAIKPVITDRDDEDRQYLVSVGECGDCGYVHFFSPQPIMEKKLSKPEGHV